MYNPCVVFVCSVMLFSSSRVCRPPSVLSLSASWEYFIKFQIKTRADWFRFWLINHVNACGFDVGHTAEGTSVDHISVVSHPHIDYRHRNQQKRFLKQGSYQTL